jgi:hypothetical protein
MPGWLKPLLGRIHPGCFVALLTVVVQSHPPLPEGRRVDLPVAALAATYRWPTRPTGSVAGVDMTDEQLAVSASTKPTSRPVGYSMYVMHGH